MEFSERALHEYKDDKDGQYRCLMNKGMCHFMCTEIPQAIDTFNQVIEIKQDDATAHYTLGITYIMNSQYEEAA